jgi:hypothetical protein
MAGTKRYQRKTKPLHIPRAQALSAVRLSRSSQASEVYSLDAKHGRTAATAHPRVSLHGAATTSRNACVRTALLCLLRGSVAAASATGRGCSSGALAPVAAAAIAFARIARQCLLNALHCVD